jgi:hypothetical protein
LVFFLRFYKEFPRELHKTFAFLEVFFPAAFVAEADDELSVAPGDSVVVQAEIDGWYQVTRVSDGKRGLVPASYVTATQ